MESLLFLATILGGVAALGYLLEKWLGYAAQRRQALKESGLHLDDAPVDRITKPIYEPNSPQEQVDRSDSLSITPEKIIEEPKKVMSKADSDAKQFGDNAGPSNKESISMLTKSALTALPLSGVLRALNSDELTPLQRSDFVERHNGRHVVWEAQVRGIEKLWEHEQESDIIAVIEPPAAEKRGVQTLATAVFPYTERAHISHIRTGECLTIEGELQFRVLGRDWSVSLRNARYLSTVDCPEQTGI